MSILSSLYTGASGLNAHGEAINVVGDNIANVSTVGFKGSRASFGDLVGDVPVAGGQRTGQGVRMAGIQTLFGRGQMTQTGNKLDLGIDGNGFFAVKGNHSGSTGTWYTRDGRFKLDDSRTVVNMEGLRLQGYMIDAAGVTATSPSDITLNMQYPPNATTTTTIHVNLNAADAAPAAWNIATPSTTSNYSTQQTYYDSLGAAHTATIYFRNTGAANTWEWHALVDGGELTGGVKGTPGEIANGTLAFTPNGALDTATTIASSANFLNAVQAQVITFDFGSQLSTGGTGLDGTTRFSQASNVNLTDQDGYTAGTLSDIDISDKGVITGHFSNGLTRAVATVALATFQSNEGLERSGAQLFTATPHSGEALVAAPATGDRGAIASGSVEASNVDLGRELVTLIAYQRAFEANSKTITTADQMLSEINNLKR